MKHKTQWPANTKLILIVSSIDRLYAVFHTSLIIAGKKSKPEPSVSALYWVLHYDCRCSALVSLISRYSDCVYIPYYIIYTSLFEMVICLIHHTLCAIYEHPVSMNDMRSDHIVVNVCSPGYETSFWRAISYWVDELTMFSIYFVWLLNPLAFYVDTIESMRT